MLNQVARHQNTCESSDAVFSKAKDILDNMRIVTKRDLENSYIGPYIFEYEGPFKDSKMYSNNLRSRCDLQSF